MSNTLSSTAISALFAQDTHEDLICLITFYDPINTNTVIGRICDSWTTRLSETDDNIVYGVVSNSQQFIYLPLQLSLPTEEEANPPTASITIYDVTQYLTPLIRTLEGPPKVKFELALRGSPNTIEVSYTDLYISSITYSANEVRASLTAINYSVEPFPSHTFSPQYFPGIY